MSGLKVLFLNQIPEVNNKYTFSLARALIKNGVDVTVCGIEDDNMNAHTDVPYVNIFGCYSKEKNVISKIVSYEKSWKRILNYCKDNKVNIVHVQWYIFSPLDWFFHKKLRKMGIKVVTTIHDLLPFNKKFYDDYYHKKIYSNSDMVINQARMNETSLVSEFGVQKQKISYVPHGHYMEYAEEASKEESRKKLNIKNNRPVILFFGQIKKVKGVDVLIKAMRQVVDKHPDALCVISGKIWKDDFSVYEELIKSLNLQNNVQKNIRFIEDDEIKYFFNAADIVALPYLQIYQSGVVLLAYAYEKPVVATTEGEFLTVIKDNETGILVPAGNVDRLAEALNWYLDNPKCAEQFAAAGKKDISERLSWNTIAKQIKAIYYSVI